MSYAPEVQQAAEQWLTHHRATEDPRTIALILRRAQEIHEEQGGYFSTAHCERAYLELCAEKKIQPFRGSFAEKTEVSAVPQDVVAYIERTSAYELQRRYKSDPVFRAHYDLHQQQQQQPKPEATESLTPEQYHAMPARELQVKLRDPQFKLQVMQLIRKGQI
jgi:hypothetical protein